MCTLKFLKEFFYLTFLSIFILSCKNFKIEAKGPSIKDSGWLSNAAYSRLIKAYKDENLSNDTVLLGFRIGMNQIEVEEHLNKLIREQRVFNIDDKLYALIPTTEQSKDDIGGVHQFVLELMLQLKESDSKLNGIAGYIYGPRYYFKAESSTDPMGTKYIHPKTYVPKLKQLLENGLIENYRAKYGSENHILADSISGLGYIWFSQGRIINLDLKNDYQGIAQDYKIQPVPSSYGQFSDLVYLGTFIYRPISVEYSRTWLRDSEVTIDYLDLKIKEKEKLELKAQADRSGI